MNPTSSSQRLVLLLMALACIVATPAARAQANANPPERMTFQGFLADGNGTPLGGGAPKNFDVIFRIMTAQTGGTTNWTEQQTVTVDAGNFSVLFGEGTPVGSEPHPVLSTLFTNNTASDRYVEMTVKGIGAGNSDVTILPRLRLLTSPYAFLAKNAIGAANLVNAAGTALVSGSGTTVTVSGSVSAASFSGNGNGLTNLSATNILSGTLSDARLSSNVPLLNGTNVFTGTNRIAGVLLATNDGNQVSGTFRGNGAALTNLTLGSNVALLSASSQTFTGTNFFNNIQLGTDMPLARLEIQAGADNGGGSDGKAIALAWHGGGYRHFIRSRHNSAVGDTGNAIDFFINSSGTQGGSTAPGTGNIPVMSITGNGNVGIGTTSPTQGRLQISGSPNRVGSGSTVYWAQNGATTWTGAADPGGLTAIYADGRIVGLGFISTSDARIKKVAGRSNPVRDLATLMDIEITDYTYVDVLVKGTNSHKKVIAQQVEKVFPQAVSKSTDAVPDIYQAAQVRDGWVKLSTNLKKGERVRLIGKTQETIQEVLDVAEGQFRTDFNAPEGQVFVYGRVVNDFRSVDYEAIAMLNVSATQELTRKMNGQENELAALRAEVAKLHAERAALEQSVSNLAARDRTWEARFAQLELAVAAAAGSKAQARAQATEDVAEVSSLTR